MHSNIVYTEVRKLFQAFGCAVTAPPLSPTTLFRVRRYKGTRPRKLPLFWMQHGQGTLVRVPIHRPQLVSIPEKPSTVGIRAYHTAWVRARRAQLRAQA